MWSDVTSTGYDNSFGKRYTAPFQRTQGCTTLLTPKIACLSVDIESHSVVTKCICGDIKMCLFRGRCHSSQLQLWQFDTWTYSIILSISCLSSLALCLPPGIAVSHCIKWSGGRSFSKYVTQSSRSWRKLSCIPVLVLAWPGDQIPGRRRARSIRSCAAAHLCCSYLRGGSESRRWGAEGCLRENGMCDPGEMWSSS